MSIRIPYPLPDTWRSRLIAAGQEACALQLNTEERRRASANVRKVEAEIISRHGYEEGETQ